MPWINQTGTSELLPADRSRLQAQQQPVTQQAADDKRHLLGSSDAAELPWQQEAQCTVEASSSEPPVAALLLIIPH